MGYYVHLNLIERRGCPGGPGSYSHYLDLGAGSRPIYSAKPAALVKPDKVLRSVLC